MLMQFDVRLFQFGKFARNLAMTGCGVTCTGLSVCSVVLI